MERSACSASMSRRYRSAAIQRASMSTSRVTAAVTFGLPCRSPPIQDAMCTGATSIGSGGRLRRARASSMSRRHAGRASHSEFSTTAKPHFASSWGDEPSRRTSSVCQASAMSRSRRRSLGRGRFSSAAIASYLSTSVRRSTSVGWGVRTDSTRLVASAAATSSGDSRSKRLAQAVCASSSRLRTWWSCSAMLARWRNWLNARVTSMTS